MIQKVLYDADIEIVDSADSITQMARDTLQELDLMNTGDPGDFQCFVSDRPQRFQELAERFLGTKIPNVQITQLI